MLLLMTFALLAGALTAVSPCVLPILPAVLGAGASGGRRRPLGIVAGLVLAFTFSAVALVYVIEALGLPNDVQRTVAIVVLAGFGLALLFPPLSDRMEAWISRIVGAPRMRRGEGFGSGMLLGAGLGLAYFPCAGPILAGVITVSAAQDFTVGRLAVAGAYAIGSGLVLYALMLGGRRALDRLKPVRGYVQMAMGGLMILVAVAIAANLDTRFQTAVADDLPSFLTGTVDRIQESDKVREEVAQISPHGAASVEAGAGEAKAGEPLPVVAEAPDFTDTQEWFNTDGEQLSIEQLTKGEGKVVLIDFWTYTCINCIRTLPELKAWDEKYGDEGLEIVGVHSPEFPFEREADNVRASIEQNELEYAVVQDNQLGTWDAFTNQFWPAKYLIDAEGRIRYIHFGEGEYDTTEQAIRSLLAEAGETKLGGLSKAKPERAAPGLGTPETYLGAARADGYINGRWPTGINDFGAIGNKEIVANLPPNAFALQGRWRNSTDDATALAKARIDAHYRARRVFLVMGSPKRERTVEVLLDGKPIPDDLAGPDVKNGRVEVGEQRLYRLVDTGVAEQHVLSLKPQRGVSAYAFTFG